jgi:hypothetical protein
MAVFRPLQLRRYRKGKKLNLLMLRVLPVSLFDFPLFFILDTVAEGERWAGTVSAPGLHCSQQFLL